MIVAFFKTLFLFNTPMDAYPTLLAVNLSPLIDMTDLLSKTANFRLGFLAKSGTIIYSPGDIDTVSPCLITYLFTFVIKVPPIILISIPLTIGLIYPYLSP